MTRSKRARQREAQRRQNAHRSKIGEPPKKKQTTRSTDSQARSERGTLPGGVRLIVWLTAAFITIAIPSYILYKVNSPTKDNSSLSQQIMQRISGNFSFGFSQADISKLVTLQGDDAMSITWTRLSDGSLQTIYQLGPYTVQNMATKAKVMVMVPDSANLVQCGYADLNTNAGAGGAHYIPVVDTKFTSRNTTTEKFYSTALAPNQDPKGLYYIDLGFIWDTPIVTHTGVGKYSIYLHYQGRFSPDPAAHFEPADTVKIKYDTADSGDPTGLPRGVYLKYQSSSSETVTTAAPPPNTTSENTQIWIADADRPTLDISVSTENGTINEILQLGEQGIFLIIGGAIGATFPRLRRKQAKDENASDQ